MAVSGARPAVAESPSGTPSWLAAGPFLVEPVSTLVSPEVVPDEQALRPRTAVRARPRESKREKEYMKTETSKKTEWAAR